MSDSVTVTYRYDALGRRTAMTDTLGTTTYVYDDLGRLVSVSDPLTGTVGYGYDLNGNRTQLIYPGGKVVTCTYDADNRLVQVEDWDGGLTSYAYDEAGWLITTTLPNGVATVNQHDDAKRLTQVEHENADDELLARYTYALDNVGNRVQAMETISTPGQGLVTTMIAYTYDSFYRLTKADYSSGERFQYVYNAVGSRTIYTTTLAQTTVTTYSYDAANQLVSAGGVGYTWDDLGNLLSDGTFTYTYDAASRLVGVQGVTVTLAYTYNGEGLRVGQTFNGVETTFIWDSQAGLPVVISDTETLYLHTPGGQALAEQRAGAWTRPLGDSLGNVRQWSSSDGKVLGSVGYRPFGTPEWTEGAVESAYGYTGQYHEPAAGLIYLRARHYAPALGRFLQRDPWQGDHLRPQTLHLYAYVENNAVNFADRVGLCTSCKRGSVVTVGGTGGVGLRARAKPSEDAWTRTMLPDGSRVVIAEDEPVWGSGRDWHSSYLIEGQINYGQVWLANEFLLDDPQPPPSPNPAFDVDFGDLSIVRRAEWGARPPDLSDPFDAYCNPGGLLDYDNRGWLNTIIVHHTGAESRTYDEPYDRVRNMQSSHMNTRGYPDIGYHFIIGGEGTIFEGAELRYRGTHTLKGTRAQ